MTIKMQVAKDQRRGKWFTVNMDSGIASCSCGGNNAKVCAHITAIRTGTYLTK